MKILFIVHHLMNADDGISKKILSQIKGFQKHGYEVDFCYLKRLHYDTKKVNEKTNTESLTVTNKIVYMLNDKVMTYFSNSLFGFINFRLCQKILFNHINLQNYLFVYIRYNLDADPFFLSFLNTIHRQKLPIYMEIPTIPYNMEFVSRNPLKLLGHWIEQICVGKFKKYITRIITFSATTKFAGIKTINISNGIDFDIVPLRQAPKQDDSVIHCLGVASLQFWHAYERLIYGIADYLNLPSSGKRNITFTIVGAGNPKVIHALKELVNKLNLTEHVFFTGPLHGTALDDIFNKSNLAIGCLGCHRKGIDKIKPLKNVEYAARGIPFIYSETDDNFTGKEYVWNVPPDESPLSVTDIIKFYDKKDWNPKEIRESVLGTLDWATQIEIILEAIRKI